MRMRIRVAVLVALGALVVLAGTPRDALAFPLDDEPLAPPGAEPAPVPPAPPPPPPAPPPATEPPAPVAAPHGHPYAVPPRPRRFGERGQSYVTSELTLSGSVTRYDQTQGELLSFALRVGAMRFVTDGLALGGSVFLTSTASRLAIPYSNASFTQTRLDATRWGGALAAAYALPLGDRFTLLPNVALGLESVMSTDLTDNDRPSSWLVPRARAFVPFVVHPSQGFFVGLGPSFDHSFEGRLDGAVEGPFSRNRAPETTRIAVESVVGAYLDSEGPVEAVPFGRAHDVVLSSESSTALSYLSNARANARDTHLSLTPSVDYFVLDHLSVGLGARASFSRSETDLPDGVKAETTALERSSVRAAFGGVARVGAAVPLASFVSWFPRVGFGLDHRFMKDTIRDATPLRSSSWVPYLSVDAPLVAHAGRGLVGVGPYFARDLVSQPVVQYGPEVQKLQFGVSAIVGGWR